MNKLGAFRGAGAPTCLALILLLTAATSASARSYATTAWGGNSYGQLGNGTAAEYDGLPGPVRGLNGVTAMSAGQFHSMALLANGTVVSWGENVFGQLGDGTNVSSYVPVQVGGLTGVKAISNGVWDSFAVLGSGSVMAWGENALGQLGDGTNTNRHLPVQVSGLGGVKAVAGGFFQTLALLEDGEVRAWGNNLFGELGDGSTTNSNVPVSVGGSEPLTGAVAVAAGENHSLALMGDGTVMAWGANYDGQLGNGTIHGYSEVPVEVSGLSGVTAIAAAGGYSLALLEDGTVMAWGDNVFDELGDGDTSEFSAVPVPVRGLRDVTAIAAGARHGVALLADGSVRAWGSDELEQLGDGRHENSDVPVAVRNVSAVSGIAAGGYHTLTYSEESPPEYGRCVKLAKAARGSYATAACTVPATPTKFGFEWEQGPGPDAGFITQLKSPGTATIETVGKASIVCKDEKGKGEFTGLKTVGEVVVVLAGCESQSHKCTTAGSAEGEIVSGALGGELGWENKASGRVADDLHAEGQGPILRFTCGVVAGEVRGSVIVKSASNKMASTETLKYRAKSGRQKPEQFEGGSVDVLETSIGGSPFEQSGLSLTTLQTDEEKIETNAST